MSNEEKQLADVAFGRQEPAQSMGAMEAMTTGIAEAAKAFVSGVGQVYDVAQASPTLNAWAAHGATELMAGISGNGAFLPYGWGSPQQGEKNEQQLANEAFGRVEISPPNTPELEQKQGLSL